MANKEQNLENPDSHAPGAGPGDQRQVDASRRKFTGTGLGVSAIFTLASQPVLAGACKSPSGDQSGNLSHHGPAVICSGQSPAYWVAYDQTVKDGDPLIKGTKFHDVFDKSKNIVDYDGEDIDYGGKASMKKVMEDIGKTGDTKKPQPLGAEFAAAWVNIKKGLIPSSVLTETSLHNMWLELLTKGSYLPMAGAKEWFPLDVITYLKKTHT